MSGRVDYPLSLDDAEKFRWRTSNGSNITVKKMASEHIINAWRVVFKGGRGRNIKIAFKTVLESRGYNIELLLECIKKDMTYRQIEDKYGNEMIRLKTEKELLDAGRKVLKNATSEGAVPVQKKPKKNTANNNEFNYPGFTDALWSY